MSASKFSARMEAITPEMAYEWMERTKAYYAKRGRPHNFKPLSMRVVAALAEDIGTPRWDEENGEAIKLDEHGNVIDGQHRLEACMLAGRPLRTLVVRGVAAVMVMDQGRPRTLLHHLRNQGVRYFAIASSVTRSILGTDMKTGRYISESQGWVSPAASRAIYLKYEREINDATDYVMNEIGGNRGKSLCANTILAYALVMTRKVDRVKADTFAHRVISGLDLVETSPAYQFRQRVIANAKGEAKLRRSSVIFLLMKAWRLYLEGTPCTSLRYSDNEHPPTWGFEEESEANEKPKRGRPRKAATP